MTPDPTPQPAHDHGAAGFCTDHAKALDERGEYRCRRDPACTDRWWPPSHSQRCAEENRAAGFCTDHGQPAARPTTVAEAVEVAYRAHLEARKGAPLAPGEFEATRSRVETKWMAAVLEAVGYAALLAEVERLETAVRRKDNHKRRANDQRDEARADLAALRTGNARERVAAAMYDGNEAFHAALASDRGQEYRRIERPSWADTDEYYRALYRARADAALAALGLTVTGGEGE